MHHDAGSRLAGSRSERGGAEETQERRDHPPAKTKNEYTTGDDNDKDVVRSSSTAHKDGRGDASPLPQETGFISFTRRLMPGRPPPGGFLGMWLRVTQGHSGSCRQRPQSSGRERSSDRRPLPRTSAPPFLSGFKSWPLRRPGSQGLVTGRQRSRKTCACPAGGHGPRGAQRDTARLPWTDAQTGFSLSYKLQSEDHGVRSGRHGNARQRQPEHRPDSLRESASGPASSCPVTVRTA